MKPISAENFDIAAHVRAGDRVIFGQASAEPLTLTRMLVARKAEIGPFSVFLGACYSECFTPEKAKGIAVSAYGAVGVAGQLARAGKLDVLPWHYSALNRAYAEGTLKADVVLLQLSIDPQTGRLGLGFSNDYAVLAARHARTVIAELNPAAPWPHDSELPSDIVPDVLVEASFPPLDIPQPPIDETSRTIARHVVEMIPDGATLQFGVGSLPEAVMGSLSGHRNLGIHSGSMGDRLVDLVEGGAVTNARKSLDAGRSVAGVLLGTKRLRDFVHANKDFSLRPAAHTHGHDVLTRQRGFIAVNSAIEVDLTGQVNAEMANGRYVGAVGGQVDFVRGANAAEGGRAIIALPATARDGTVSRIVANVSNVTTPRSDVDAIVTEYGVAALRGCTLEERAKRLIAIAAPQFREALSRSLHEQNRGAHG